MTEWKNQLYYGDNLDILRKKIKEESVDLCYIDPPFNSKRTYNQLYNNIGEDKAQTQAFIDTWTWNDLAIQGFQEIITNFEGRFTEQTIELIKGLKNIIKQGSLLAYLVSMTLRITEIHRVLKPTGSFYLHCDPTASHYLKLVLDSIFCAQGGEFRNEIIWLYTRMAAKNQKQYSKAHDVIFWYSKSDKWTFNVDEVRMPYSQGSLNRKGYTLNRLGSGYSKEGITVLNEIGKFPEDWFSIIFPEDFIKILYSVKNEEFFEKSDSEDWTQIPYLRGNERLGYPTQKPEALLERIIKASSNENDVILDAYCGCGTTVAVAQRLKRKWIGIDITYQSISLIIKRLEDSFEKTISENIVLDGVPKDMESARALANKKDDRLRKEFEKWAILTYSNNRAIINTKKGADKGIDGIAYFLTSYSETEKILFQVKSGNVNRATIATLRGDMERESAEIGILLTLEEPTKPMFTEAAATGLYEHKLTGLFYHKIQIVTTKEMIEQKKRLEIPLSIDVLKSAIEKSDSVQLTLQK